MNSTACALLEDGTREPDTAGMLGRAFHCCYGKFHGLTESSFCACVGVGTSGGAAGASRPSSWTFGIAAEVTLPRVQMSSSRMLRVPLGMCTVQGLKVLGPGCGLDLHAHLLHCG